MGSCLRFRWGELPNTSYKSSCYINLFRYTVKTGVMPWNQIIHNVYTTQSSCNLKCKNSSTLDGGMRPKRPSVFMNAVACCRCTNIYNVLQIRCTHHILSSTGRGCYWKNYFCDFFWMPCYTHKHVWSK